MTATMGFSWVFALIIPHLFLGCDGFLLDDRNKPATTSRSLLTDENYNALFNLIVHERQSRAKLEQQLARMEQELLATQQGVTDIYHTSTDNNATLKQQTKNWNALYAKYNDLENDNNLIKSKLDSVLMKQSNLENYTKVLEQEVASLRQLKGVTDLQTILSVRNETKVLREELKITNNSLNSVRNDAEARKQDFVALLIKEQKLEISIKALDNNFNIVSETLRQTDLKIKYQNRTLENLLENLELEIHNKSNRYALTVCATDNTYSSGDIILFSQVQTRYGVSDSIVSSLRITGKFICEKAGLYLISGYFMTNTEGHVFLTFDTNGQTIAFMYFSVETVGNSFQTSSISTIKYLNINDNLYTMAHFDIRVWGSSYSSITILQLTNG